MRRGVPAEGGGRARWCRQHLVVSLKWRLCSYWARQAAKYAARRGKIKLTEIYTVESIREASVVLVQAEVCTFLEALEHLHHLSLLLAVRLRVLFDRIMHGGLVERLRALCVGLLSAIRAECLKLSLFLE